MAKTDKGNGKAETAKPNKAEKPVVTVETVKPKKAKDAPKNVETERVSGTHRVFFMPNGNNPKLGSKMLRPAADTAQYMVDRGFGHVVKEEELKEKKGK